MIGWFSRNKIKIFAALVFLLILGVFTLRGRPKGFIVSDDSSSQLNVANFLSQPSNLPIEGRAPELKGLADWINSGPLSLEMLRGKVVLVDFWTYSCINCVRTIPHLSEWHRKYKDNGFVILGVHSPEFDFEKKRDNVEEAVKKYGIEYPVALDSAHETWNVFANQYWPAHYLIDVSGNIRYRNFGEGHYAETETAIQNLLREAELLTLDKITEVKEPPPDADYRNIGTPEIYLGYLRINNVGNEDADVRPDAAHTFAAPDEIAENRFYFVGAWTIGPEAAELSEGGGKLLLRYKANKVNIVAGAKDGQEIPVEILWDGKKLTTVGIGSPTLYNLVDAPGESGWHTLEIRIPRPGLRVFTFTFG